MLDLKTIRKDIDATKHALSKRKAEYATELDALYSLDQQRRRMQQDADTLKAQRNQLSKSVKSADAADSVRSAVDAINKQLTVFDRECADIDKQIERILMYLPNIPAPDVPIGCDESQNQIVTTWGDQHKRNTNSMPHYDIADKLGMLDQVRTTYMCGSRFSTFVGMGARLQRALITFMLDEAQQNGYLELAVPAMIRGDILRGTGQLPKFAEDLYAIKDSDLYLIPTAEVPLTGFFSDGTIYAAQDFPKRLCAYTPCFRQEAGAAGRDTRGLIRQHQFDKVELVHLCLPEQSDAEHERLVQHAESILQKLELPYRKLLLCTGDMGFSAKKCYDLEVWFPSQNTYREISSCSNCGDFQARRLGLRFRLDRQTEFLHTLNGSGLAVGRCWAAILENYYDMTTGVFSVPSVLRRYMPDC